MDAFMLPLTIIGSKYDQFLVSIWRRRATSFDTTFVCMSRADYLQDTIEPKERSTIYKTLRFVAHYHYASLQCLTLRQEPLVNRARALVSNMAFDTSAPQTFQVCAREYR